MIFDNRKGFTLIEVMVTVAILAILIMVVATLLVRTTDTYGQLMNETDALKQARQCMDLLSRDIRESVAVGISNGGDALLIRSARMSDSAANPVPGGFQIDADPYNPAGTTFLPIESSVILVYTNTTPQGIPQLVRLQLYYNEDLGAFAGGYNFPIGINAYSGSNILIVDSAGTTIPIDRATGAIGGTNPYKPPRVLMNQAQATANVPLPGQPFIITSPASNLYRVDLTCQYADRYGRTATSILRTELLQRNIYGSL